MHLLSGEMEGGAKLKLVEKLQSVVRQCFATEYRKLGITIPTSLQAGKVLAATTLETQLGKLKKLRGGDFTVEGSKILEFREVSPSPSHPHPHPSPLTPHPHPHPHCSTD